MKQVIPETVVLDSVKAGFFDMESLLFVWQGLAILVEAGNTCLEVNPTGVFIGYSLVLLAWFTKPGNGVIIWVEGSGLNLGENCPFKH